jgi:hypothetical protein
MWGETSVYIFVRVLKLCWMVDNTIQFWAACSVFLKLDRGPHFSHRWCRLNGTPSTLSNKAHISANRIIPSSTLSLFTTWSACKYCSYRNFVYLTVNMMSPSQKYILWERPIPLLWAGSRTVRDIPNCLNNCVIFIVYTQFISVDAGRIILLGGPQVGDPWFRSCALRTLNNTVW